MRLTPVRAFAWGFASAVALGAGVVAAGLGAGAVAAPGASPTAKGGASELPAAARTAVATRYPGAQLREVEPERRTVRLWEVEVVHEGQTHELTVTADGTVLEVEHGLDTGQPPAEVAQAVERLGLGELVELERIEVFAELRAVPIDPSRVEYEVEVRTDRGERELRLGADGRVLDSPDADRDEAEDDDDNRRGIQPRY